jgi:hypothetical protein
MYRRRASFVPSVHWGVDALAQSAHASSCDNGCGRIYWDEASYRRTTSPRAMCIGNSTNSLQYRTAWERTLAISHVWAHGQGGRPEEGINRCLHRRYCGLASKHGCDSYWIDSACIPSDDALRSEAITKINTIFATSKAVLVIDKDVQSVELGNHQIDRLETVLSVLLVCDWNVRAWTMLEATRGSRAIYILCKRDEMVPLAHLMHQVWKEGSIPLAILMGSARHLMPSLDRTQRLRAEEAGYILSQRHASRPGDDVVILGLLTGSKFLSHVAKFWKEQETVKTAYLMSSAPRIQGTPGLGWAPLTPTNVPQERRVRCGLVDQMFKARYHSYDGYGSYEGHIANEGLRSKWLYKDLDDNFPEKYQERLCEKLPAYDGMQPELFLNAGPEMPEDLEVWAFPDAALAYQEICELQRTFRVRVLKPVAANGQSPYTGGDDRGDYTGNSAAITFSRDCGSSWEWAGVHQWIDEDLVTWERGDMLVV